MSSSTLVSSELTRTIGLECKNPGRYSIPDGIAIAAILDSGRGDRTLVAISCNTDWHISPFFLLGLSMLVM